MYSLANKLFCLFFTSSNSSEGKGSDIRKEISSSVAKSEMDDSFDLFIPGKIVKLKTNSHISESTEDEPVGKTDKHESKTSSYFDEKPKGKSNVSKQCPICLLSFVNLKHHMSYCTRKYKVSQQVVDDAIKIQSEFIERRKSIGLTSTGGSLDGCDMEYEVFFTSFHKLYWEL